MKNLRIGILAIALLIGSVAPAHAAVNAYEAVDQDAKKQEVSMKDLPANVVEDVKTNYKDASFVTAWKWQEADGTVKGYDVVLKQDGKELTLKYDGKGEARVK